MRQPLDGIRIIDLTQFVAGPMATMLLADQGADVIKVEPIGRGDLTRHLGASPSPGLAPMFVTTNRNKRSIAVDLKAAEGRNLIRRLTASCDLFVQNFRPGVVERLGLDEPSLRGERPDLVYTSISGFGETGPYAHKRAYDPIIQAASGLADIQADPESGRPRMIRLIVPDKVTALSAAQAMTSALLGRARDGQGRHVRLSMLDAVVAFHWPEGMADRTFLEAREPSPRWTSRRDLIFETLDGYLTAGVVSDQEWESLARAVGHPEWIDDPRFATPSGRVAHAEERLEMTATALLEKTTGEWLEILDRAGVPCAPVVRREELASDPQIVANRLLVEHAHPRVGLVREPRPAARFGDDEAPWRPAPFLGEHTDDILGELGLSGEVGNLRRAGVVG